MAFSETRASRTVAAGICPVEITLAEACYAGDTLGISSATWVLSAHASGEAPLLVAGTDGASGDKIQAYPMAIVDRTVSGAATLGEIVALHDTGYYVAAGSELPDVGFVVDADTLALIPLKTQMDTKRS